MESVATLYGARVAMARADVRRHRTTARRIVRASVLRRKRLRPAAQPLRKATAPLRATAATALLHGGCEEEGQPPRRRSSAVESGRRHRPDL